MTRTTGRPCSRALSKISFAIRSTVGIAVEQIHRLAQLLERRDERIVVPQQHLVIELLVDPALDDALDVAEVADHVAVVERAGPDLDLGGRIVPVRMLADAVVVEQPMAVTELDSLGDGVHIG